MVSAAIVRDDSNALDGDPPSDITAGRRNWLNAVADRYKNAYKAIIVSLLENYINGEKKTKYQGTRDEQEDQYRVALEKAGGRAKKLARNLEDAFVKNVPVGSLYPTGIPEVEQNALEQLTQQIQRLSEEEIRRGESNLVIQAIHKGWIATIDKFIKLDSPSLRSEQSEPAPISLSNSPRHPPGASSRHLPQPSSAPAARQSKKPAPAAYRTGPQMQPRRPGSRP